MTDGEKALAAIDAVDKFIEKTGQSLPAGDVGADVRSTFNALRNQLEQERATQAARNSK